MPWELVERDDTLLGSDQPFISLVTGHIGFNAVFSRLAELDETKKVTIRVDVKNRRMGFEFHTEEREHAFTLCHQSSARRGEKRRGMQCTAAGIYARYDWIKKVSTLPTNKDRRFLPKLEGKWWVIQLCPAFEEKRDRRSRDIPSDAEGIYRYKQDDDEIVYIGRGQIKKRLSSPEREDWDFSIVEYSVVNDPDDRIEWEDYWIERFKEENNGKLPFYNRVSGTKR
jgi:hypothetical protein